MKPSDIVLMFHRVAKLRRELGLRVDYGAVCEFIADLGNLSFFLVWRTCLDEEM